MIKAQTVQNEFPYINAKIKGIKTGAWYEDRVYDQAVYLELPDGKTIDVFDHMMICKPEMIDSIKKVTILVSLVVIKKVSGQVYEVIPDSARDNLYKSRGKGHLFYGKIVSKDDKSHYLIVNVGCGSIISDAHGHFNEFQVGDFVEIYSVRADLDRIQDLIDNAQTFYDTMLFYLLCIRE